MLDLPHNFKISHAFGLDPGPSTDRALHLSKVMSSSSSSLMAGPHALTEVREYPATGEDIEINDKSSPTIEATDWLMIVTVEAEVGLVINALCEDSLLVILHILPTLRLLYREQLAVMTS